MSVNTDKNLAEIKKFCLDKIADHYFEDPPTLEEMSIINAFKSVINKIKDLEKEQSLRQTMTPEVRDKK